MNVLLEVALEGCSIDIANCDLSKRAKQGVLLLNSALTTGIKFPHLLMDEKQEKVVYHLDYWCPFTKLLIEY